MGDFELATHLVVSRADRIEPLATQTFPFDEVAAAFATAYKCAWTGSPLR